MLDTVAQMENLNSPGTLNFPWLFTIPLIITVLLTVIADWLWWQYNVKPLRKIPTANSSKTYFIATRMFSSILRNTTTDANVLFFQLLQGMIRVQQLQRIGLFYLWTGFRPVVILYTPQFLEAILKSPNNLQKSFDYTFLSLWLKEGLVTSFGNKWRHRRRAITSAFHYKILENFVAVFDKQSKYMVKKLSEAIPNQEYIDVIPFTTMCTLDVICETAMGITLNAQDNNDSVYVKRMHRVAEGFVARVFRPWLWPDWIFFNSRRGKQFIADTAAMDKFTRQVIQDRKAVMLEKIKGGKLLESEETKRRAFLDLLLDMHLSDPKNFTESDVQEEVDSFMFAGHDTTAVGTAWTLYLLGLHQDIQNKCIEEIDQIFGDDLEKPVTEECLKELKYQDLVIKESQRLFPPAPYIGRQLQEDVDVGGYRIPKGTTCMLVIYMLHRDPYLYPHPEKFDPDRFLPENSAERHPFAYVPFSAGPRSCIGQKFAMLEEKTIICNILRNFRIEAVEERDKLHLSAEMVLRCRGGVKLRFIPRR